jgi:hypothetical protein
MTSSIQIHTSQACSHRDLTSIWTSIPSQAQGLLMTLKQANLWAKKPAAVPQDLHEGRFFWNRNEVYFRRVQRATVTGLQISYQVIICDADGSFHNLPGGFAKHQAVPIAEQSFFISRFFQATQQKETNPAVLRCDVKLRTQKWQIGTDFYQQWLHISSLGKEQAV